LAGQSDEKAGKKGVSSARTSEERLFCGGQNIGRAGSIRGGTKKRQNKTITELVTCVHGNVFKLPGPYTVFP